MNSIMKSAEDVLSENDMARRAYITSTIKIRSHQRSFREKVIHAYQSQCAFCKLRYAERYELLFYRLPPYSVRIYEEEEQDTV